MDKEQINKTRFLGQHIGCQFTHPDIEGTDELLGVADVFDPSAYGSAGWYDTERCKLALRPLSYITENELIVCAKLAEYKDPSQPQIQYIKNCLLHDLKLHIEIRQHWAISDYLRSLGFCTPFMGLDPVAEGWAVLGEPKDSTAQ